ncbi:response regulator transcription factor [Dactylosporangium sp. NPDC050588]|uniref:response regulator transcription factor n=1 Tax=Dactylosporangium sp. NPDC050588 TaxID=3157211 RepID=UPI00340B0839
MEILVVTGMQPVGRVLPALDLLTHGRRVAGYDVQACLTGTEPDVVLVDARRQLAEARAFCRAVRGSAVRTPVVVVVEEAGLVALAADWGFDDVVLAGAGPAEIDARLRLVTQAAAVAAKAATSVITAGALHIDPDTYAAKLKGRALDLTYKEFELLRFLARHPGRVYTRDQLLREVWGFDYFGGHRTVDVHVRRLRAKLGSEYESMIGTVRQVGYTLVLPPRPELEPLAEQTEPVLQRA